MYVRTKLSGLSRSEEAREEPKATGNKTGVAKDKHAFGATYIENEDCKGNHLFSSPPLPQIPKAGCTSASKIMEKL